MLNIIMRGHNYRYEIGELVKLFIEKDEIYFIDHEALVKDQSFLLVSSLTHRFDKLYCAAKLMQGNLVLFEQKIAYSIKNTNTLQKKKISKRGIKVCIYDVLSQFYRVSPPWGILTGVRPIKIVHELRDQGYDTNSIYNILKEEYRIQSQKIELLIKISKIQRPFISLNSDEQVSIYISIPFCPTRCLYCSFPSNPLSCNEENQISNYFNALLYEIQEIGKILKKLNKKIETLYIGGGTPTTLSASQLDLLLTAVKENMSIENLKEITVEAGRPDTITLDKLKILKAHRVNRISINPQTMNSKTLELIGRVHSIEDVFEAYNMAYDLKFDTINMDLIIGLPGENPEMFENTMKKIKLLEPENVTVHTLAIKRNSGLKKHFKNYIFPDEKEAEKMLRISWEYMEQIGLIPYYLYRQKYMLGNLENVGYCLPGHECIYNIQIMGERQSIIGLGAGAVSKIFYPKENRLERVPNVTNVEQYVSRIEEMIERKRKELEKSI